MTSYHLLAFCCAIVLSATVCFAQTKVAPANYDEAKVPQFELPDALKTNDGRTVDSAELWNTVRRPELLKIFTDEMFGKLPIDHETLTQFGYDMSISGAANGAESIVFDGEGNMLIFGPANKTESIVFDGKGKRYQFLLRFKKAFAKENLPYIKLLVYTPNNVKGETPVFIGLNFQGNHTVADDPGIILGTVWKNQKPVPDDEKNRGNQASRWQIEMLLERGYAVATVHYFDFEPDFNGGSKFGVRKFIEQEGEPCDGNAIATWAWGCSTILNVLQKMNSGRLNIDLKKAIIIGHSRLGKAALWAGAMDSRFAMVISNDSGCGGAALSRREYGETVHRINTAFPHWFNENFKKYNLDVNALPMDQHELIALIAPRPVYIASAVDDRWADPKGEFLSGLYADPVYRLLGTDGFAGVKEMPEVNKPVGGTIGYHIRSGGHDINKYDWEQYLNFADKHFGKAK